MSNKKDPVLEKLKIAFREARAQKAVGVTDNYKEINRTLKDLGKYMMIKRKLQRTKCTQSTES